MAIDTKSLTIGNQYERPELAEKWGYKGQQAIARGAVTPRGDNKIVLFITKYNQDHLPQYKNELNEDELNIQGETNHANDERIINSSSNGDEIYLFYRERARQPFTYHGLIELDSFKRNTEEPSNFTFKILHKK